MANSSKCLRGSAMLIIWGGVDDASVDEESLNDWWTNEHLPERLAIPGFLRTRRFYAADEKMGSSQYLVWYEVASLDTLTSPAYMAALNDPTPRTKKFMPLLASMNRSACRVVLSAARPEFDKCSGGGLGVTMAHIVFQPPSSADARKRLQDWIGEKGWPGLVQHPSSLALHLIEHDDVASCSGSSTKSYDEVRFQSARSAVEGRWIVLIEFAEPLGAPFSKHRLLTASFLSQLEALEASDVQARFYGLICAMNE